MHIDRKEKLQPFGFYIHGSEDGYSWKALCIKCSTNKKSPTTLEFVKNGVREFSFPQRVCSDKGDN